MGWRSGCWGEGVRWQTGYGVFSFHVKLRRGMAGPLWLSGWGCEVVPGWASSVSRETEAWGGGGGGRESMSAPDLGLGALR